MGDSNVESSNLARKVMKIDGNPRVNLLRGSSKGNDTSKTNSSSRYPVRGMAVDSKMMTNPKLIDKESELLAAFRVASLDEERFLKQKSKVHWLAEGDANTKYFHNTLKCRNHRARIDVITDSNGILHEGKGVPKAFVDHYVGFLGREEAVIIPITQDLFDVRRCQLINSVISSLHVFWSSVFILPIRIMHDIEAKMRDFLWARGPLKRSRARVSWKDVCRPKTEGGLGIKRLRDMNKALMSFHIWSIVSKRPSVWVDWIQQYRFGLVGLLLFTFMGHVPGMN
ncbi:hypothetical protein QVD17_41556 [Tagetes erecta]|uniref:Reverse transcriptase n=1 Tax=Tagetes erecta TaxID=13708 RepID=A0AAD8JKP6_TARER|nr:hypothetical protein QVD17_41556 [Tagetes erecta]